MHRKRELLPIHRTTKHRPRGQSLWGFYRLITLTCDHTQCCCLVIGNLPPTLKVKCTTSCQYRNRPAHSQVCLGCCFPGTNCYSIVNSIFQSIAGVQSIPQLCSRVSRAYLPAICNHCIQTVQTSSIIYSANLWINIHSIHISFVHKCLVLRLLCANLVCIYVQIISRSKHKRN